ncbi:hypothetical protein [Lysinibacillus sp. 54212]|uniref:hypothetical protein n=1 Tax=Lysinibacillus sp. 54212 TaxID=3119829 RepID=UPI002FC7EA07
MELREEISRYVTLEVLLRTLERDKNYLTSLKMSEVFNEWYQLKVNEVYEEFKNVKKTLYNAGCRIDKGENDGVITQYFVLICGKTEESRYSNITLKNRVTNEMRKLLGMEYRKPYEQKEPSTD